jgi:hypothetical protein
LSAQEVKTFIESIMMANKGLSTETWGLLFALVSAFATLIYTFFSTFEKRLVEQSDNLKQAIDGQNIIHDKINQSLMTLNSTLQVTNWRTKALEDAYKTMDTEVTLIKDRMAKNERTMISNFAATKLAVKKEIDEELSKRN